MSEWWTYAPADFLLFSPRVYYRMLELHNGALWPLQLVMLALGIAILVMAIRGGGRTERIVGVLLGGLWIWVAWSFLWERYATINWAVAYVAPVFVAQGLALVAAGLARDRTGAAARGGLRCACVALLVAAIVAYPLIGPGLGRPWSAAEVFGIVADPTAVATLAYLALARQSGWLMIVPVLWCALSSETLWLLHAPDFFIPMAGAFAAVLLRIARARLQTLP